MVILQGDVFWVNFPPPSGSGPGFRHPQVVIQNNLLNRSAIHTILVCGVTSNLALASAHGNVLLYRGEGNLPKRSVVNVSQVATVDKTDFGDKIGTLTRDRVRAILDGLRLITEPQESIHQPS